MEKVYVYKNSNGDYKVHPAVVVVSGGSQFKVINATNVTLKVVMPTGASDPSNPVTTEIAANDKDNIDTRSQGSGKTKAFNYDVKTLSGTSAHGNSDPILIIEN